jgi:hypothetical protein
VVVSDDCIHVNEGLRLYDKLRELRSYHLFVPVGVQIVGRRWEDEKVIGMMHVVDQALGPRGFGPGKSQQIKA